MAQCVYFFKLVIEGATNRGVLLFKGVRILFQTQISHFRELNNLKLNQISALFLVSEDVSDVFTVLNHMYSEYLVSPSTTLTYRIHRTHLMYLDTYLMNFGGATIRGGAYIISNGSWRVPLFGGCHYYGT